MLSSQFGNAGVDSYDLRYAAVSPGDAQSCMDSSFRSATIASAYELITLANNFPFGDIRVELTGTDSSGQASEWLVLLSRAIDAPVVESITYRDYTDLAYSAAMDEMAQYLGWDSTSNIDQYVLGYRDPVTGEEREVSLASYAALTDAVDALDAGSYELRLQKIDFLGTVNTRYVSINKLPVDVVTTVADLQVAWTAPTSREDGSVLNADDIAGYEIYLTMFDTSGQSRDQVFVVDDPAQTQYVLQDLSDGEYHLAIATVDKDGQKSGLSDIVSHTIN